MVYGYRRWVVCSYKTVQPNPIVLTMIRMLITMTKMGFTYALLIKKSRNSRRDPSLTSFRGNEMDEG